MVPHAKRGLQLPPSLRLGSAVLLALTCLGARMGQPRLPLPAAAQAPDQFVVTTLAGADQPGADDGPNLVARFDAPRGVAVDAFGTVYVADPGNSRIRAIAPDGTVSTIAGTGGPGFADGPAAEARFQRPTDIAVDETMLMGLVVTEGTLIFIAFMFFTVAGGVEMAVEEIPSISVPLTFTSIGCMGLGT